MTKRFDGAITTPDDEISDQTVVPEPERPPRPALVELASALLIVGGITALVGWLAAEVAGRGAPASAGLLPAIILGLNVVADRDGDRHPPGPLLAHLHQRRGHRDLPLPDRPAQSAWRCSTWRSMRSCSMR